MLSLPDGLPEIVCEGGFAELVCQAVRGGSLVSCVGLFGTRRGPERVEFAGKLTAFLRGAFVARPGYCALMEIPRR